MKYCPHCTNGYHDSCIACPTHGGLLSEIRDLKPGMVIRGTYRIVRKLGRGGMGEVYLAEHTLMGEGEFRALKFLSPELSADPSFTSRFLREVRALRQVRNENVVDCSDLERAEDDSLFFSMEFVEGTDLHNFLAGARGPLNVPLALEIACGIAKGLGAAHAKGIVHRDIKPQNILLSRDGDGRPVPKIADFGIVATREGNFTRTRTGMSLLTPAYAAPEQWLGTPSAELDGRTDLYALGGILFEMLTGRTAFHVESYEGWRQQHLNAAPPAPSSLRSELANWKGLDQLVLRLLAKDRAQRPTDAAEVLRLLGAVTLRSYKAREETIVEKSAPVWSKAKKRYILFLALGLMIYGISFALIVIPGESANSGIRGWSCALVTLTTGWAWISHPEEWRTDTLYNLSMLFSGWINPLFLISLLMRIWRKTHGFTSTMTCIVLSLQVFCWIAFKWHSPREGYYVWVAGMALALFAGPIAGRIAGVSQAARGQDPLSALGKSKNASFGRNFFWANTTIVLAALAVGGLSVWHGPQDAAGKSTAPESDSSVPELRTIKDRAGPIAFAPDSRILASGHNDPDAPAGSKHFINFWDVSSGQVVRTQGKYSDGFSENIYTTEFSPDGRTFVSGSDGGIIKLWNTKNGQLLHTIQGDGDLILQTVFSPNGKLLASSGGDSVVRLWNVSSGQLLRELQPQVSGDLGGCLAFSPDGKTLATSEDDFNLKRYEIDLWDVSAGKLIRSFQGHTNFVSSVSFSPDGHTLASGSGDKTVKLWDVASGQLKSTLPGNEDAIEFVAFSPDGRLLVSSSSNGGVALWDVANGQTLQKLQGGYTADNKSVAFSPDGQVLAHIDSLNGIIKLWDVSRLR